MTVKQRETYLKHQIRGLTQPLCPAWGIFYLLPKNEWETK